MACAAEQSGSDEFIVDLEIHQPTLDYTASSQLLLALKKKAEQSGSDESKIDLELQRALFKDRFLPDSTFWLSWIEERIEASGSDLAFLDGIDDFFDMALSNCACVQIALEWIHNILNRHEAGLMDQKVTQSLLEDVVSEYGVDIMDGANLYSCLTEFQLGIIEDMVDVAANEDNIRTAKEALVATYRRQYALPLLGNQRSLSKFEDLLSEICVESDAEWIKPEMLLEKFKRSEQLLQSRVLYEQNIISESFLSSSLGDQVTAWKTYIQFEIEDKQPARARRLFERSVIANHQSLELWQDFAEFAESTLKQWDVVESVACRALKVHHINIDLWLQYFIAIESSKSNPQPSLRSHNSSNVTNLKSKMAASGSSGGDDQKFTRAMEKALTCRFASADDYLAILLHSCDIRRRKLQKAVQSVPKDMPVQGTIALRSSLVNSVHATRNAFQRAESFLSTYYPDWCSGWLQVYKYEASVEDEIIADVAEMFENGPFASQSHSDSSDLEGVDPSKAGYVWERAVVRFSKYHYVWGEYIQWGRAAFDYDLCRNLYRRALKAVKDHVEETCKSYLLFEQQVGSLDDLCVARGRTKALLKNSKIRLRKAAEAAKEEAKAKALKRTKRNLPPVPVNHIISSAGSAVGVDHASSCDDSSSTAQVNISGDKRVLEQQTIKERDFDLADNSVSETDHENEQGLRKRMKVESDVDNVQGHSAVLSQSVKRSSDADDSNTICVKNLSFNSTIEDVLSCLKPCGEVNNAVLVLSKAGKSRGQAIIEFKERSSAAEALLLKGSIIGERAIEVEMSPKHDFDEAAPGSSSKAPSTHHPTTVFVSKFPKTLTNADLKGLFIQCGSVIEARIMVDKRTGVSKCHGLVQFLEEEGKNAALRLNKKEIDSYILSVLPSKFPALNEAPKGSSGHYGPTSDKADHHAEESTSEDVKRPATIMKSTLSFRPRKLAIKPML